jgi:hypothetical protein
MVDREMVRDVVVEAGVDCAGAEPVKEGAKREERPGEGGGVVESSQGDECAACREKNAHVKNLQEPTGEKAGEKVTAAAAEEDPGDMALGERKVVADRWPGNADQRIRQAETDKAKVTN